MDDILVRLEDAENAFYLPLRMGEGYNEENFQRLCQAIRNVNKYYAQSDMLPKKCVLLLVGLSSAIEGCKPFYDDAIKQRLLDASIILEELILEGL